MQDDHPFTNSLITETSPYLLQHAHNPVQWHAWSAAVFEQARQEDKLVLVSIGYSSCHWCHVMEHESFEDPSVAALMNEHFVCIKVDREERPDVDQVYMAAVQLMTGQGGWPLNCFTLPDGKPVYGGTYFPKEQWKQVLAQLSNFYKNNKAKAVEYAEELTQGIQSTEVVKLNEEKISFTPDHTKQMVDPWRKHFDNTEGGPNRAPKFPLPNNYEFLLRYYALSKDQSILDHVVLSLNKMAYGGIYDQVGGGFSRYSTDLNWKVPHFEKMLYDNAQLVSLYSMAYQLTKDELYKDVVYDTLKFIAREMTSPEGGFYSALDADSEGEEGKYYVWKKESLANIIPNKDHFNIIAAYFNVNETGYWEHGNYILCRKKTEEQIALQFSISIDELRKIISEVKELLLKERDKRIHPGLDDKQLTSWNALMIKGYCDAYDTFGEQRFLDAAIKNAQLILKALRQPDGGLFHSYKSGKATIKGYLEDYSFLCEALIALYQSTFEEQWLKEAKQLADYTIAHFFDKSTGMFWFTSNLSPALVARKKEINDNVIPASNSSMAKALYYLGVYFENSEYAAMATQMLSNVNEKMPAYGSGYSNWGILLLHYAFPFYEIVMAGKDADQKRIDMNKHFVPNKILAGSNNKNATISLLTNRYLDNKTLLYVCENRTCKLPVEEVEEALKIIQ